MSQREKSRLFPCGLGDADSEKKITDPVRSIGNCQMLYYRRDILISENSFVCRRSAVGRGGELFQSVILNTHPSP